MSGFPEVHRRLAGAKCGRPDRAVGHTEIHVEARRVDGHVVKAVAGQAEHHRGQPPDHAAARLGDEGVHPAVGQIVDPRCGQVKAVKADLPLIIVKLIRQLIHGILLQSDSCRRSASLRCRPAGSDGPLFSPARCRYKRSDFPHVPSGNRSCRTESCSCPPPR